MFRRLVLLTNAEHIGKEANRIDEVAAGLISRPDEIYNLYEDTCELARQVLATVPSETAAVKF